MARALGRYELLRPLARGGMAEVFLARRRAAGIEKWLVVKRMRPETSGDPRFLALFVREARLSMSLVHQNIVPVFDFGRIDDQVFLAMERVEGRDLGSSLARAPSHRLPPLLAAFIAAECCQALDYAHQRKSPDGVALGVVHRDVTPRNVLLSWSGEVKLTDFGIAALAGDATARLLGTPHYMAPEQARSEPIDPRADIYAIGLVLREAITGVRPRPGADRDALLEAARRGELMAWPHLAGAAPDASGSPRELALGTGDHTGGGPAADAPPPAALIAIVERATAAAPADRYPDARSMLEDLDSFIVADRAARKAESPSRQLAGWLAAVWEGARTDREADAAIEADHLVSFLDDGALDVIGTGTVRSLAATAADDASPAPPGPSPGGKPISAAALRPADPTARPGHVSSSHTTVASGSFNAIPADDDELPPRVVRVARVTSAPTARPRDRARRTARRRSIAPLASIVVAALVGAGVVWWVADRREASHATVAASGERPGGERPGGDGVPLEPTTPPAGATASPPEPPTPGATASPPEPSTPGATAGSASAERPDPGHPGSPAPVAVGAARPRSGQPTAGQPHPTAGSATHPNGSARPPALPEPSISSTSSSRTAATAAAPAAATTALPAPPATPATCRVRINLAPWAYFTADGDTARHETPSTIELTPGPHRLHVWNPELNIARDITINVPADRDTMNYSEPLKPTSIDPHAP